MSGTPIRISRLHFPVRALGPGARIGIWLQGCSIRCPGCISLDTWSTSRGETSVEAVLEAIAPWLAKAEGFTISGGEPFDQPHALKSLLTSIRAVHPSDILVYSGHPFEVLPLQEFDGLFDALISDPLVLAASQTLPLRGSDNQRLHIATELGRLRFADLSEPDAMQNTLDVMFDDTTGDVFLAGIPQRGDLARLQKLLELGGHTAGITEDKRQYS
jgi:anaerobic ribonucleoside-triphosphate reductase activating protein